MGGVNVFDMAVAEGVAQAAIARMGVDFALQPQLTEKAGDGWVFFYESRAFIRTGEVQHRLAGNGPIFVSAAGAVTMLPTHTPWQQAIPTFPQSAP